jgi:hypothetical protein
MKILNHQFTLFNDTILRRILLLVLLISLFLTLDLKAQPPKDKKWKLVWRDEFKGKKSMKVSGLPAILKDAQTLMERMLGGIKTTATLITMGI